jgi:hypothetical protein
MTNRGVYITLPVIDLSPMLGGGLLAVLTCMVKETIPTKLRKFKKCVMVIPLCRSRTGADIFHRPGWQTRPLLLDHTAMREARMQTLYMETPNPRNELQHTNQAEFSYAVGGVDLALTERIPYYIYCTNARRKATTLPPHSIAISISFEDSIQHCPYSTAATLLADLKFCTPKTSLLGHGSFFLLLRYSQGPKPGCSTLTGSSLASGDGWLSLTSFMLNAEARTAAFEPPMEKINVGELNPRSLPQHLHCRQIPDPWNWGGNGSVHFEFSVEDSP